MLERGTSVAARVKEFEDLQVGDSSSSCIPPGIVLAQIVSLPQFVATACAEHGRHGTGLSCTLGHCLLAIWSLLRSQLHRQQLGSPSA